MKGFVTLAKNVNDDIITTHCFLHREALVAKTLPPELKNVLDQVVKMINFIKSRPRLSRLLSKLCRDMDSDYLILLFHTDVRWLSRGKALLRVFQLEDELLQCFIAEGKDKFLNNLKKNRSGRLNLHIL